MPEKANKSRQAEQKAKLQQKLDDNGFNMEVWYKHTLESYEYKYSISKSEYLKYIRK